MPDFWKTWFKDNFHIVVLFLLFLVLLTMTLYLAHVGVKPENLDWAKEQIAAVLGALVYALKPISSGGVNAK